MTRRFRFRKSWGGEFAGGGAAFRLWAPSQERMSLRAAEGGVELPMRRADDGWFEVETDAVGEDRGYHFVLDDGTAVPDPAARAQLFDVHGPSRLIDPARYEWRSPDWKGRPWKEAVIYELHVGTFTPEGTFDGVLSRLDHLAETGFTAIELLPIAQFAGRRGWGYDGVCLYAPHEVYGGPEGLKRLVDAAHQRDLMVLLDVVYNHFGPEGNYLHLYAPDFFHPERQTPWGPAIAYEKEPVRNFFIENALFWLEEYRFDGLRLDAVDQIADQSDEPILEELARAVRERITDRHVHLTTEDDRNVTGLHERNPDGTVRLYTAEWNDDFHHAAHAIATAETIGYYSDYSDRPAEHLARALASGYVYQGEPSPFRDGQPRGESSSHLPPDAFIDFLQNHDQIGNRAYSERLAALAAPALVEALLAVLLLSPQIPLLFMGEEWGETHPFGFFTDFHGDLADAVRGGRRREFAKWPHFASDEHGARIADPNDAATFAAARLDWEKAAAPEHRQRLALVRRLLDVRRREIVPLIAEIGGNAGSYEMLGDSAIAVRWRLASGGTLCLHANLGAEPFPRADASGARLILAHANPDPARLAAGAVVSTLEEGAHFVPLPI
ncbi:MAG TPA: malto-oligosyltrehalose trehalohydrolase [Propylenella sp.]